MGNEHRVAGHARELAMLTRPPADRAWGVRCRCGWIALGRTKHEAEKLYREHKDAAPAYCRDCGAALHGRGRHLCPSCRTAATRRWAERNPARWEAGRRRSWLKKKYDMTPEQYDEIFAGQGGVCAICGTPPEDPRGYRMHIDHCRHDTARIRGVLCGPCNRGIGQFRDDPALLEAAIAYLRRSPCLP